MKRPPDWHAVISQTIRMRGIPQAATAAGKVSSPAAVLSDTRWRNTSEVCMSEASADTPSAEEPELAAMVLRSLCSGVKWGPSTPDSPLLEAVASDWQLVGRNALMAEMHTVPVGVGWSLSDGWQLPVSNSAWRGHVYWKHNDGRRRLAATGARTWLAGRSRKCLDITQRPRHMA